MKKFVADMNDMGSPKWFRSDNGGEIISNSYVDYYESVEICRGYTGSAQAATERSGTECDMARAKREPCGWPRGQGPFSWRRRRQHSQRRCRRQPAMAGGCILGCCLLKSLRHKGEHRVVVAVRGVRVANTGATDGPIFF